MFIPVQNFYHLATKKTKSHLKKKHGFVYQLACATENWSEDYIRECTRRLEKHVKDLMACNHSSYLVKHAVEKGQFSVQIDRFEVIGIGNSNNTVHAKEKLQRFYIS